MQAAVLHNDAARKGTCDKVCAIKPPWVHNVGPVPRSETQAAHRLVAPIWPHFNGGKRGNDAFGLNHTDSTLRWGSLVQIVGVVESVSARHLHLVFTDDGPLHIHGKGVLLLHQPGDSRSADSKD